MSSSACRTGCDPRRRSGAGVTSQGSAGGFGERRETLQTRGPAPVEVLDVHAVPEVVLAELEPGTVAVRAEVDLHDRGWAVRRRVPRHPELFKGVVAADATAGPV